MVQNPLDEQTTQQLLSSNDYKTAPEYKQALTDTQVGQSMSSLAAGQNAKVLQPFKQNAERMQLESDMGQRRNEAQIQAIDDALGDNEAKFQPGVRDALERQRMGLVERFKNTPKFAGQRELVETKTDSNEYIKELDRQLKEALAREKASQEKPLTMSQAEAIARNRLAANPNDAEAAKWLKDYEVFKQKTQPGMGQVTLDPTTHKLTTVQGNVGGSGGGTTDLQSMIQAEIERRKQQGK
jgi:hypothetical protein